MLLVVYLGTTAFVWITTFKFIHDMDKRLKKEGYKFTVRKLGGIGDIAISGLFLIAMSVPIFQLIFPISNLDRESSYDEYKNLLLEAGAIEEPDQEIINQIYEIEPQEINTTNEIKQEKTVHKVAEYKPYIPKYRDEDTNEYDILDKGRSYKKVLNNRKK